MFSLCYNINGDYMKQNIIVFGSVVLILLLTLIIVLIVGNKNKVSEVMTYEYNTYTESGIVKNTLTYQETKEVTNVVKIDTSKGLIFVELYPEIAPITVKNFQSLVRSNYYKDMIFHRVIKNFMIQTGDPTGTGSGGAPNKIKGEFKSNGVENNLEHKRGVISMARANGQNDSASSQFFIMHKDNEDLNGDYAAFGNTIAGLEVVDKIATVKTNKNDKPLEDIKLNSIKFVNIIDE